MAGLLSDLRDAVRQLFRDRTITVLAVGLLSLTAGTTAAVYAVVHAVILVPPALGSPARTVVIWEHDEARASPVVEVARGQVEAWREQSASIEASAVFTSVTDSMSIVEARERTRFETTWVSAPFFDITGIAAARGRTFAADDEAGIGPRTMVISHRFWIGRFMGDPGVVGRVIRVQRGGDAVPDLVEIVGVMPEGFDFPRGTDAWVPAAPILRTMVREPGDEVWYLESFRMFLALARLREGVAVATADRELDAIVRRSESGSRPTVGVVAAAVGVVFTWAAGPYIAGLLVDVPPGDPLSLAGAAVGTLVLGATACLVPAARAARTNPADILRA